MRSPLVTPRWSLFNYLANAPSSDGLRVLDIARISNHRRPSPVSGLQALTKISLSRALCQTDGRSSPYTSAKRTLFNKGSFCERSSVSCWSGSGWGLFFRTPLLDTCRGCRLPSVANRPPGRTFHAAFGRRDGPGVLSSLINSHALVVLPESNRPTVAIAFIAGWALSRPGPSRGLRPSRW